MWTIRDLRFTIDLKNSNDLRSSIAIDVNDSWSSIVIDHNDRWVTIDD